MQAMFLSLAILFTMSVPALAQVPSIPLLAERVTIDGRLDEPVWQRATEFSGFHNFYPNDEGLADQPTMVRVFHDGEKIYISAVYFDSTEKSVVSSLKRDDHSGALVASDAFGIVIDAFNKKNTGYYFTLNAAATQLDALVNFDGSSYNIDTNWNAIWEARTTTEGSQKIYEIAIPFKAINFDGKNATWRFQFFTHDIKANNWMTSSPLSNNFLQFDLRFTEAVTIAQLPTTSTSRFTVTPSLTSNYQEETLTNSREATLIPSLDIQYNLTSSLRLDATLNPDFSQVEVDQQITNLTRFAVDFPEQRTFFLENSDLFANLGPTDVNPFYSRIVGREGRIQFGLKLSGNLTPTTRIGILNVQTEESRQLPSQNFGTFVLQQQLTKLFSTTLFLVSRQATDAFELLRSYNRVGGINVNYKSADNRWVGLANFGKSYRPSSSEENAFYNVSMRYSARTLRGSASVQRVDENYLTDVGFVPRLYHYDAANDRTVIEGYAKSDVSLTLLSIPATSKHIQSFRYFSPSNTTYWDHAGAVTQSSSRLNQNIWFRNAAAVYWNVKHDYINLRYGFDPLGNENYISTGEYHFTSFGAEYRSPNNKNVVVRAGLQHGGYYDGTRTTFTANTTFRMLPIAKVGLDYEANYLNINQLGSRLFHLARFTGEVFFHNRLNWTTYLQYNTQRNNFNINSRLQWEYQPLSYVYLVVTDNHLQTLERTHWGVALKVNYRLDF